MKQALLRITMPPSCLPLYAGQFKEAVARHADGDAGVPASVWHYTESGQAIPNAEPDIRFVGGKQWLGILSQSGHLDALMRLMPHALSVASAHAGAPVPVELQHPDFGLELTDYPVRYFVRDAVAKHANRHQGPLEALLVSMICRRLAAARDAYQLDLPVAAPRDNGRIFWEDDHQVLTERLGLFAADVRSIGMRLETAQGMTRQYVGLLNGSFVMNAKLKGVWQIGNLMSRGHGRVIMATGAR